MTLQSKIQNLKSKIELSVAEALAGFIPRQSKIQNLKPKIDLSVAQALARAYCSTLIWR